MNPFIVFAGNAIVVLAVERAMSIFFTKRRTNIFLVVISYILVCAVLMLHSTQVDLALTTIAVYLASLVVTLNYESTITKRFAALAWGHLVMNSATTFFQAFMFFAPATSSINVVGIIFVLSASVVYIAAFVTQRLFKNIAIPVHNMHKLLLPFLFVPITQIFVIIFIQANFYIAAVIQGTSNSLGIAFLFFYLYYSISKSLERDIKSALHSQEREYYFTQCQLMQESVDKMKAYRHDVKLHLATLKDFTAGNKSEEATAYINSLLGSINEGEIFSDTGNIAFDSIINFKLKDVLQDNIDLQIKIFVPPQLNIEVADVVTILGNLLDNAFDAIADIEDKIIKLTVEASKGNLFIKVDNTFDGVVKYADSEGKKNITTKKSGDNHGYGLKNVRKSVEKYNGHIDITCEDNVFSVAILMYVGG